MRQATVVSRPCAGGDGRGARVQQHEAAGAVRVLGAARLEARLAEQRRLLIARDAGDRHAGRQPAEVARLADDAARIDDRRQHLARDAEQRAASRRPTSTVREVEAQRARGVGHVGGVHAAAGELPDEPGVDGAEGELAALGPAPRAGHVVEQPADLRAGEVRVEHEPGALAHERLRARRPSARRTAAAVRRHCQTIARWIGRAGRALPDDRRLALVGDADRGDLGAGHAAPRPAPRRAASPIVVQISSGSCSTQPGCG